MLKLMEYIGQFGNLNTGEKNLIQELFKKKQIKKGDYIEESGKVSNHLAYVEKGVFRSLYFNKIGDDFTRYFIYEGRFVGNHNSFTNRIPSIDYIEAVTDAELSAISWNDFKTLEKNIKSWPLVMAKLYAFVAESKLKVANVMMNLDARDRYEMFLSYYPGLANRVPLNMLASYLGLTPSSLSRIRRIS